MFRKIIVNATKNCLVPVNIEVRVNSIIYLVRNVVFVKDFLGGADSLRRVWARGKASEEKDRDGYIIFFIWKMISVISTNAQIKVNNILFRDV